jgi:predicted dehydrogenase
VVLGVTLQHRFRPAAERLADLLRDGQLGSIVSCSTTIRLWRPQSYYDQPGRGTLARDGGGVLITQGIHTLDLLGALMGRVAEAKSFVRSSAVHRMETEDLVAAAVRFENGAIGVVEATTAAYPGSAERIAIIGTTGTAVLEGNALTVQWQDGRREALAAELGGGGTGANPMDFPHDWHRGVWTDFLDAIATGGKPRISGRDALDVHRLIDALLAGDRDATKGSNRA